MTLQNGDSYIHTALGYRDDDENIIITDDIDLATMTGKYEDELAEESADPADYEWDETEDAEEIEEDDEEEDETEELIYSVAENLKDETIQPNMLTGTNRGADGWASDDPLTSVECTPMTDTVLGVHWAASGNNPLRWATPIDDDAIPEAVTVSFWWRASAPTGLSVDVDGVPSDTQSNHNSEQLDEDGNPLDLSGSWLRFDALFDLEYYDDGDGGSYVSIYTDAAAEIDICDFKVEAGDSLTAWAGSTEEEGPEAMAAAKDAAKVATNFINFDSAKGLCIADMAEIDANGDPTGANVLIKSGGFEVRMGTTVLASYASNKIALGTNSKSAIIDLLNGSGTIKAGTFKDKRYDNVVRALLQILSGDVLNISADEVRLTARLDYDNSTATGMVIPYHAGGDHLQGVVNTGGYITGSSKQVRFSVPLSKPVLPGVLLDVTNVDLRVRQGGKYLYGATSTTWATASNIEAEYGFDNCINIVATMDNTTNVAQNNAPCGIVANIDMSFYYSN